MIVIALVQKNISCIIYYSVWEYYESFSARGLGEETDFETSTSVY